MKKVSLGIDTSCYFTSCAAMVEDDVAADERRILTVKEGERGLRQSDALFMHMKNLPELVETTFAKLLENKVNIVCVSELPRRLKDSYMPVFLASSSFGRVLASALHAEYCAISHQEGHIAAGILSSGHEELLEEDFLTLHLSGGTTELLYVQPKLERDCAFSAKIIGGTKDLNAGQFIDRVGVTLGFTFPAGPELEQCANESSCGEGLLKLHVHTEGTWLSFSGPESQVRRMIACKKYGKAEIAKATFAALASSVSEICTSALAQTGCKKILAVGGVTANTYLRKYLTEQVASFADGSHEMIFATPKLSGDNAVGAAYIGQLLYNG